MTRVSENSSINSIKYSVGKTKSKLEDLQIKGSNLKRVQKPSDDPIGNIDILSIRSQTIDNKQYLRNASVAKTQLAYTENAIEELTNIMNKAKEIAIGQSSNLYDPSVRQSIAKEVSQLRLQALGIGNRRMGNKYIFSGHKSLTRPFNQEGQYFGDANQTKIEVSKDFFVPSNFSGDEIFFEKENTKFVDAQKLDLRALQDTPIDQGTEEFTEGNVVRDPAGQSETENGQEIQVQSNLNESRKTIFDTLQSLENALITNNPQIVQTLLPQIDDSIDQLIVTRTKIGSVINSIDVATNSIEKDNLANAEYKSRIEDADVAELFGDLARQQNVLNATYKASAQLMNQSLLDFIR